MSHLGCVTAKYIKDFGGCLTRMCNECYVGIYLSIIKSEVLN